MTPTKDTLTEEECVKLAEWLGFVNKFVNYFDRKETYVWYLPGKFGPYSFGVLKGWLDSAEGERAITDKVEEDYEIVSGRSETNGNRWVRIQRYHPTLPGRILPGKEYWADEPTRIRAIQRAVLKAIGGQ